MFRILVVLIVVVSIGRPEGCVAQQVADAEFQPVVEHPTYPTGTGPIVAIDEAHHNFHTREGRYAAFASLVGADGFQVARNVALFEGGVDDSIDVLVIANSLHGTNAKDWSLPTPSAFTPLEIDVLEAWVSNGGSLFLIADHMPFPGAASDLAKRFGVEMANGFAFATDTAGQTIRGPIVFTSENGGLGSHPILNGNSIDQQVSEVASFTGQAFRAVSNKRGWVGLLNLPLGTVSLEPEVAWQFDDDTRRRDVSGWYQGAAANLGRGRVVVFGEAAMFSAQRSARGGQKMGMAAKIAVDNQQLLLNIVHWLSRDLARWEEDGFANLNGLASTNSAGGCRLADGSAVLRNGRLHRLGACRESRGCRRRFGRRFGRRRCR